MKKYKFTISGNTYDVDILEVEGDLAKIEVNGTSYLVEIHHDTKMGKTPTLVRPLIREPQKPIEKKDSGIGTVIKAPLPGVVLEILVKPGDIVEAGQKLLVMEAMKMENEIKAVQKGKVSLIMVSKGQSVLQDEVLLEMN